jgi:hypothetical protein
MNTYRIAGTDSLTHPQQKDRNGLAALARPKGTLSYIVCSSKVLIDTTDTQLPSIQISRQAQNRRELFTSHTQMQIRSSATAQEWYALRI